MDNDFDKAKSEPVLGLTTADVDKLRKLSERVDALESELRTLKGSQA